MRKNSIRKFVHAVLDLIPLFIIPIFAIYTRNENYNSNIEIQVQEKMSVDFNQKFNTNNFASSDARSSTTMQDCLIQFTLTSGGIYNNDIFQTTGYNVSFVPNHKYYPKLVLLQGSVALNENLFLYPSYMEINKISTTSSTSSRLHYYASSIPTNVDIQFYFNVFDLTQMFGTDNEPTKVQFDALFDANYYPYTESQKMLVDKPTPTTYDDTDVGSQFVYTLYNATDKYFNMNNVFNMNDVYDWFVLNIFGGNAPLGLYIVWNIVLYEFVMDLLMLLYCVFMFFIDCCTKLIEKPLNAIK